MNIPASFKKKSCSAIALSMTLFVGAGIFAATPAQAQNSVKTSSYESIAEETSNQFITWRAISTLNTIAAAVDDPILKTAPAVQDIANLTLDALLTEGEYVPESEYGTVKKVLFTIEPNNIDPGYIAARETINDLTEDSTHVAFASVIHEEGSIEVVAIILNATKEVPDSWEPSTLDRPTYVPEAYTPENWSSTNPHPNYRNNNSDYADMMERYENASFPVPNNELFLVVEDRLPESLKATYLEAYNSYVEAYEKTVNEKDYIYLSDLTEAINSVLLEKETFSAAHALENRVLEYVVTALDDEHATLDEWISTQSHNMSEILEPYSLVQDDVYEWLSEAVNTQVTALNNLFVNPPQNGELNEEYISLVAERMARLTIAVEAAMADAENLIEMNEERAEVVERYSNALTSLEVAVGEHEYLMGQIGNKLESEEIKNEYAQIISELKEYLEEYSSVEVKRTETDQLESYIDFIVDQIVEALQYSDIVLENHQLWLEKADFYEGVEAYELKYDELMSYIAGIEEELPKFAGVVDEDLINALLEAIAGQTSLYFANEIANEDLLEAANEILNDYKSDLEGAYHAVNAEYKDWVAEQEDQKKLRETYTKTYNGVMGLENRVNSALKNKGKLSKAALATQLTNDFAAAKKLAVAPDSVADNKLKDTNVKLGLAYDKVLKTLDAYDKSVKDYSTAVTAYNKAQTQLNSSLKNAESLVKSSKGKVYSTKVHTALTSSVKSAKAANVKVSTLTTYAKVTAQTKKLNSAVTDLANKSNAVKLSVAQKTYNTTLSSYKAELKKLDKALKKVKSSNKKKSTYKKIVANKKAAAKVAVKTTTLKTVKAADTQNKKLKSVITTMKKDIKKANKLK